MTEQTKDQLFSETLQYQGKIMKKKGTKKDGEEWMLWELMFETGREYPWKVSCFNSISDKGVQPADMQEGEYYEVVYKESPYTNQHGAQIGKQAVLIKDGEEANCTKDSIRKPGTGPKQNAQAPPQEAPQQQQAAPGPSKPLECSNEDWKDFAESYDAITGQEENKDKTMADPMYMLGVYVSNMEFEKFAPIITKCKKHFEDKK